jgi:N-acetylglutamate synthase-like GNAT family acetyltransferase
MLEGLEISTDRARIDVALVHDFLSTTYWAEGRPRDVIERSIANSLCFGAYLSGRQVGFARVITDRSVFGYVADVFVVPEMRGRGISKALMQAIVEDPVVSGLKLLLLRTRDAHGLYKQFGFEAVERPDELMAKK